MTHKKTCPFCNKSSPDIHFTKEHILRNKFNSLFPETPGTTIWENKSIHSDGGMDAKPVTITIPLGPFDGTVNSVCNECNSGWMNNLENQAEASLVELFYARRKFPRTKNLETLAFWAAKTAAVYALKHRDNLPGFPIEHYAKMKTELKPPPLTYVWYCQTVFNKETHFRYYRGSLPGVWDSSFHLTTINIGHALFSILGSSTHEMSNELIPETKVRDKLQGRIWPEGAYRSRPTITVNTKRELIQVGELMHPTIISY
ncbi:hypothetical protein ACVK1X_003854 [Pseudomonas sp. PvR086]|jgi:hypothetical protein|uniref:hypothetical protein n=1 Tax=Pseudomonas frederiksbergensis TaxID=104087 RepID=UPI002862CE72|nr:hypothetical protein [Pseudomonas frederiksbergensis]MDR7104523.1 hypothetical protein [Pseudomonas frederiksbergensis]